MKKILCAVLALLAATAILISAFGCERNVHNKDDEESTEDETLEKEEDEDAFKLEEVTLEKQLLVNKGGVKIFANGIVIDHERGARVRLIIHNDSRRPFTIQAHDVAVNGFSMDSMLSVDVRATTRAYEYVGFTLTQLEECGITSISDIEFSISIRERDSWDLHFETETFHLKTSIADTYDHEYDFWGTTLYDDGGFTVKAQGVMEPNDDFFGGVVLCSDNRSDRTVAMQVYDVTVNEYTVMPIFYAEVVPGKMAADEIRILKSDFERYGLGEVIDITFSLHIFDADSWEAIADVSDITLHYEPEGDILYKADGVYVVSKGFDEDAGHSGGLDLAVYNRGDKPVKVIVQDITVNGFAVKEKYSYETAAKKHTRAACVFPYYFLDNNEIEEVEEIVLTLLVFDSSEEGESVALGPITLNFD